MLEQQLKQAFPWLTDRDFGHHATDLYVVAYPEIDRWLQENYQFYANVAQFIGNPEANDWNGAGKRCLEIPFAGEWKRLERRLKTLEQQLKQAFPWLTDRDFGHQHRTIHPDLYVVSYPEIDRWLQENYQWYDNIDKFTGNDQADWNGSGKTCLSIPFADYSW